MKTITMYELLGLVKDGKAPKKVKYKEVLYYDEELKNYFNDEDMHPLFNYISTMLDEKVEILEEEKKIPETLIPTSLKGIDNLDEKIEIAHTDTISVIDTVNEIIDYLKSKGE